MKRTSWDYKLCPILVLMLEWETAAMYLLFSICGGCAAGKRLWHGRTESLGGPAHAVHAVRGIPWEGVGCLPCATPQQSGTLHRGQKSNQCLRQTRFCPFEYFVFGHSLWLCRIQ